MTDRRDEMARLNLEAIKDPIFSTTLELHVNYINAGGHMGHDSVVQLLQEVRERFFQSHGGSELDCEGLGVAIVNLAVEYLHEGMYGDKLFVKLGLGEIGYSSVEFKYQIYNQNKTEIARALTTSVFCNKKSRQSAHIPQKILEVFKNM